MGILIYEMRAGHAPFTDPNQMEMYRKIVEGHVQYPMHFKEDEKDIIGCFLKGDLTRRLGNMKGGVEDIKAHVFFKSINWEAMYNLQVKSPYIPKTGGDGDHSQFDRYEEEKVVWAGDDVVDPYEEIFKDF
eukprot:Opistho-2@12451